MWQRRKWAREHVIICSLQSRAGDISQLLRAWPCSWAKRFWGGCRGGGSCWTSWGDAGQRHSQLQSPWGKPGQELGEGRVGNSQTKPTTATAHPALVPTQRTRARHFQFCSGGKYPWQWVWGKEERSMKAVVRAQPGPSRLSSCGLTWGINGAGLPAHPSMFWPQEPLWKVPVLLQLGWGSWPGIPIVSPWGPPGILLDGKSAAMPQCHNWTSLKSFLGTSNYGHSNISQRWTFASQGQHAALQHSQINEPCV